MKKVVSLLLVVVLLIGCVSISAQATTAKKCSMGFARSMEPYGAGSTYHKKDAEDRLSAYVNVQTLMKELMNGISDCKASIDITEYNIPATQTNFDLICNYLFYGMPEAFNVNMVGANYWNNTNTFADFELTYHNFANTASEYDACLSKMSSAANKLLKGIQGNNKLSDVEKLLLIHDRIAMWNEYGYVDNLEDIVSHTAYGTLANRVSVCQGIAYAYMYLLNRVGIENYFCSSEDLYHGWNIVFVDGKKYHVDITWDDYDWDDDEDGVIGTVGHDNFLRSSNAMYANGHKAFDYDTTPTDTKYDSYFWQNSQSEFQLIDNELYYIDNESQQLKRYSDKKALCSVSDTWWADANNYWIGNFSRLSSDGRSLFYSKSKDIYRFDLTTNKSEKIFTPRRTKTYDLIFGFTYEDGNLICDINDEAPDGTSSVGRYIVTQAYRYKYPFSYGDVNEDGAINNKDLGMLMQYLNGWSVDANIDAGDVNADGSVNNKDYGILMQYINGWPVQLG